MNSNDSRCSIHEKVCCGLSRQNMCRQDIDLLFKFEMLRNNSNPALVNVFVFCIFVMCSFD